MPFRGLVLRIRCRKAALFDPPDPPIDARPALDTVGAVGPAGARTGPGAGRDRVIADPHCQLRPAAPVPSIGTTPADGPPAIQNPKPTIVDLGADRRPVEIGPDDDDDDDGEPQTASRPRAHDPTPARQGT